MVKVYTAREKFSMDMKYIIYKKKSGKDLTQREIDEVVQGYVKGEIPDYQMAQRNVYLPLYLCLLLTLEIKWIYLILKV